MRYYACNSCLVLVKVHGDPDLIQRLIVRHSLWKDGLPCVQDGCLDRMHHLTEAESKVAKWSSEHDVLRVLSLSAEEFFRALCGYGLPDEIGAEPEIVQALLLSSKITGVSLFRSPLGRSVLERLDLENGTCLHLASSRHGPVVFKVTRRRDEQTDYDFDVLRQDSPKDVVRSGDQGGRCSCGGGCHDSGGADQTYWEERSGDGGAHHGPEQAAQHTSGCGGDDGARDYKTNILWAENSSGIRVGHEDEGSDQGRLGGGEEGLCSDGANSTGEADTPSDSNQGVK